MCLLQSWVHDPKLTDETEVKASVKLRFRASDGKRMVVIRYRSGASLALARPSGLAAGCSAEHRVARCVCGKPHTSPRWAHDRSLQLQYKAKAKNPTFKQLEGVIKTINEQTKKAGACFCKQ